MAVWAAPPPKPHGDEADEPAGVLGTTESGDLWRERRGCKFLDKTYLALKRDGSACAPVAVSTDLGTAVLQRGRLVAARG